MRNKLFEKEWEYWSEVTISGAQITFGVFWATILLPKSVTKFVILIINGLATVILLTVGWLSIKKDNMFDYTWLGIAMGVGIIAFIVGMSIYIRKHS